MTTTMAGPSTSYDPETGIRVIIKPSQSSFFAGEPFRVTITFVNTHPPRQSDAYAPSQPSRPTAHHVRSQSYSQAPMPNTPGRSRSGSGAGSGPAPAGPTRKFQHKRGAHSISSAPLAKPPTSPGTPRSSGNLGARTPVLTARAKSLAGGASSPPSRKGLIGAGGRARASSGASVASGNSPTRKDGDATQKTDNTLPELIEQRRKRQLGKSLSVSVVHPQEFDNYRATPPSPLSAQPANDSHPKRSHTLALAQSHPHARKHSVLDGGDVSSPPSPTPPRSNSAFASYPRSWSEASASKSSFGSNSAAATPNASTSSFSLPLDSISEGQAHKAEPTGSYLPSYPNTPMLGQPYIEPGPLTPNGIGLGFPRKHLLDVPNSLHPSGDEEDHEELILYSYAQLLGQVRVTPPLGGSHSTASTSTSLAAGLVSPFLSSTPSTSSLSTQPTKEQFTTMLAMREGLLRRGGKGGGPVGGGSMDINSRVNLSAGPTPAKRRSSDGIASQPHSAATPRRTSESSAGRWTQGHARSGSITAGLLAMLSPNGIGFGSSETHGGEPRLPPQTAPAGASWTGGVPSTPSPPPGVGLGISREDGAPSDARPGHRRTSTMVRVASTMSRTPSHERRGSIGTFFGFGASSESLGGPDEPRPHTTSSSGFLTLSTSRGAGSESSGMEVQRQHFDYSSDVPMPTLETQPAMLAVDLRLGPGEEKSYTYTLLLPDNLPPTFRGKGMKFSYELVVGLCRAGSGDGKHNISKLMKIPIRLYNCVHVDRPQKPYNLLWPLSKRMDMAMPRSQAQIVEVSATSASEKNVDGSSPVGSDLKGTGSLDDVKGYARRLVNALPPPPGTYDRTGTENDPNTPPRQAYTEDVEEEEPSVGCREAVEILTRTFRKSSFDVTKDGVKVAILTFSKASFRLGETVGGVVELNEPTARARVVQLSAFLEAHESLPSAIAPASANRSLKRTYAEHYSSALINTLRTTFSLDIPADASPAFKTTIGSPRPDGYTHAPGGVEWKVRLCLLVAVASDTADAGSEGVRFKALTRDGPRGEWGSSWKALEVIKPLEKPWYTTAPPPPTDLSVVVGGGGAAAAKLPGSRSPYANGGSRGGSAASSNSSWAAFFASYLLPGSGDKEEEEEEEEEEEDEYHDGGDLELESGRESRSSSWSLPRTSRDGGDPISNSNTSHPAARVSPDHAARATEGRRHSIHHIYDGVKPDPAGGVGVGVDFEGSGGAEAWRPVKLETVECEIPIKVWPGNTAFRAMDVVFDV